MDTEYPLKSTAGQVKGEEEKKPQNKQSNLMHFGGLQFLLWSMKWTKFKKKLTCMYCTFKFPRVPPPIIENTFDNNF